MIVIAARNFSRVGGENVSKNCRKMTLEWIKSWEEDLVESQPEREMFRAEWEELRP